MTTVSTIPDGDRAIGANDQDLPPGTEVGEYRIEQLIGRGGFGTVYRAQHPVIGKLVAVKVLARKYAADEAVVSRFIAEARAVNQIRHRNIIDIFLFGQLPDGRHYYIMEYLDGETLDRHLDRHGPMPLAEALPILKAIARALDAAHGKGIAHRDLKPENIYLAHDVDGPTYPKLLDFGIAKLLAPEEDVRHRTGTGVPIGTPYYMSPEQCRGKDVDHRTDIYSFGIVIYRLLTGAYPFEGDDYLELLVKQVNDEPPPPSSKNPALPATVDAAIAWMMRKDPAQRPGTVLEGVHALDPSAVTAEGTPIRSSRPSLSPSSAPVTTPEAFAATSAQPPAAIPAKAPVKTRSSVWIGSALVLVCSAAGVMLVLNRSPDDASSSISVADNKKSDNRQLTQPLQIDAGAVKPTEVPAMVTISFTKLPPHARVKNGEVTTELAADGRFELARGDQAIELVFEAPGYTSRTIPVRPDRTQSIEVVLRPIAVSKPQSVRGHDDIPTTAQSLDQ